MMRASRIAFVLWVAFDCVPALGAKPSQSETLSSTCAASSVVGSVSDGSARETSSTSQENGSTCGVSRTHVLERILARAHDESDAIRRSIDLLKRRGAHLCWHKHSSFLDHLVGVSDILWLWGQDESLRLVGLFHSAYSNSYVNLALLNPETERHILRDVIGETAEAVVFMFCSINRQDIVVNTLLKQGFIPAEGLTVPNIRGGPDVYLSPDVLFRLAVFTMADIADQYFGWQDDLFGGGGTHGSMIIPGQDDQDRHEPTALWPGICKPGLWTSYVSQLARVAASFVNSPMNTAASSMPPVFDSGSRTLSVESDALARDLYWSVVNEDVPYDQVAAVLESCIAANPWVFEPRVLLAQRRLQAGNFTGAVEAASQALDLQHQWGSAWDKRMALNAWVAWTRVIKQRAEAREPWPNNSWGVNNLGLVYNP
jgi:hypothetical protein